MRLAPLMLPLLLLPTQQPTPEAEATPLLVVVNEANSLDDLSLKDLKEYLNLDRRYWPDKHSVTLLQRPKGEALQDYLLKEVYGKSSTQLRKHFVRLLNSGSIRRLPPVIRKDETIFKLLTREKGAFAVVVKQELPEGVKALTIDGLKPSAKGYPLQLPTPKPEPVPTPEPKPKMQARLGTDS